MVEACGESQVGDGEPFIVTVDNLHLRLLQYQRVETVDVAG